MLTSQDKERICQLFQDGNTMIKIATENGLCTETVAKVLREYGLRRKKVKRSELILLKKRYCLLVMCGLWCIVDLRPEDVECQKKMENGSILYFQKIVETFGTGYGIPTKDDRRNAKRRLRELNKQEEKKTKIQAIVECD